MSTENIEVKENKKSENVFFDFYEVNKDKYVDFKIRYPMDFNDVDTQYFTNEKDADECLKEIKDEDWEDQDYESNIRDEVECNFDIDIHNVEDMSDMSRVNVHQHIYDKVNQHYNFLKNNSDDEECKAELENFDTKEWEQTFAKILQNRLSSLNRDVKVVEVDGQKVWALVNKENTTYDR